jgi:hypothetical protein
MSKTQLINPYSLFKFEGYLIEFTDKDRYGEEFHSYKGYLISQVNGYVDNPMILDSEILNAILTVDELRAINNIR